MMQLDHPGQPCSLPASIMQLAAAAGPRTAGDRNLAFGRIVHGVLTNVGIAAEQQYQTSGPSKLLFDAALPGRISVSGVHGMHISQDKLAQAMLFGACT